MRQPSRGSRGLVSARAHSLERRGRWQRHAAQDFTAGRDAYVKDLADTDCPADFAANVEDQVLRGFDELGVAREELAGIQFNEGDTPSDSAYYELATVILKTRASGEKVEHFVPQWSPTSELTDEAE